MLSLIFVSVVFDGFQRSADEVSSTRGLIDGVILMIRDLPIGEWRKNA